MEWRQSIRVRMIEGRWRQICHLGRLICSENVARIIDFALSLAIATLSLQAERETGEKDEASS